MKSLVVDTATKLAMDKKGCLENVVSFAHLSNGQKTEESVARYENDKDMDKDKDKDLGKDKNKDKEHSIDDKGTRCCDRLPIHKLTKSLKNNANYNQNTHTSNANSKNVHILTPNYISSISPSGTVGKSVDLGCDSEFEKLRKINLSYLTLFRKSSKFSNKGFSHFFLSQELKITSDDTGDQNHHLAKEMSSQNLLSVKSSSNLSSSSETTENNPIYNLVFSHDGKYLASAGADGTIRIWEVITSENDRTVNDYDSKKSVSIPHQHRKSFIETAIGETYNDISSFVNRSRSGSESKKENGSSYDDSIMNNSNNMSFNSSSETLSNIYAPVFKSKPIKVFHHGKTINSLDWSKNNFLLTASDDCTVKLWHVERDECLQTHEFGNIITAAKFHKLDDRFCIVTDWNGRILFLSILEKQILYEINIKKPVSCFDFAPDCTSILVGCDKGFIHFIKLDTNRLEILIPEFEYQIKKNTPMVTSVQPFMHESDPNILKILVSTNDSKIRLFNYNDKCLEVRYSGYSNKFSNISSSINEDQTHVISGSDDGWCYLWQIYSNKKDKIDEPKLLNKAHFDILNFFKDDTCLIDNKHYGSFHAHNSRCNVAIFAPRAASKLLSLSSDPIYELASQYKFAVEENLIKETELNDLSSSIIVTADNKGKIKVFRRDFAYPIRKALQSKKGRQILKRKKDLKLQAASNQQSMVNHRNSLIISSTTNTYNSSGNEESSHQNWDMKSSHSSTNSVPQIKVNNSGAEDHDRDLFVPSNLYGSNKYHQTPVSSFMTDSTTPNGVDTTQVNEYHGSNFTNMNDLDQQIKDLLADTSNNGPMTDIGQTQHSPVVSGAAEEPSKTDLACKQCRSVDFTAKPINTSDNNEIRFYCNNFGLQVDPF